MYTLQGITVEVKKLTAKHLLILRAIMRQDDIDLLNTRLHLQKSDQNYDLIWSICLKKKKGWCINGYAYVEVQPNACVLRIKENLPVKWTERMEYDLLKSVERHVRSKGIKLPVWLLIGTLTVHAIA